MAVMTAAAGAAAGRQTDGPAIVVEGLVKTFGDVRALDGVDFEAAHGTVLGVRGRAARALRPRRRRRPPREDLLRWHAPPPGPRGRARRAPADHLPRRAD